eukprot:2388409-Prymnesium_polylepis.1
MVHAAAGWFSVERTGGGAAGLRKDAAVRQAALVLRVRRDTVHLPTAQPTNVVHVPRDAREGSLSAAALRITPERRATRAVRARVRDAVDACRELLPPQPRRANEHHHEADDPGGGTTEECDRPQRQ